MKDIEKQTTFNTDSIEELNDKDVTIENTEIEQIQEKSNKYLNRCAELEDRINKAIYYIEDHKYKYWTGLGEVAIEDNEFEVNTNPEDLLEILRGDNNAN